MFDSLGFQQRNQTLGQCNLGQVRSMSLYRRKFAGDVAKNTTTGEKHGYCSPLVTDHPL